MGHADYFKPGTWNVICQECGEKWKATQIRKRWDNFYVCPFCFEQRNPQDFVRGIVDKQDTPWSTGNPPNPYNGTAGTEIVSPSSGFSLTVDNNTETLFIDPVYTLATGTITMPATRPNGQFLRLYSTWNITSLTMLPNAGQTLNNPATKLIATEDAVWQYTLGTLTWKRTE